MATVKHWTDDDVDAIAQTAYMCGLAANDEGFGRATISPRAKESMPALHDATADPTSRNRRKVLRLADVLLGHYGARRAKNRA